MNKGAIQRFAIWARNELIAQVSQRAYQYGITKEGCGEANAVTVGGRALTTDEQRQRKELVEQIRSKGYTQVMEEVAYTWFNRFIALRFMEVNNYLPSHIRVFSDSTGAFKPEILNDVLHLDLPGLNADKVAEYIESNQTEALYRYLLLTQCNALNASLPRMFEQMGGYTELLLPNNILKQDSILGHMVTDIPEEDWTDQVEIIGWLYQYYNTELFNLIYDGNMSRSIVEKQMIPSATQLFTPDWVVRYMIENSLGRIFIDKRKNEGAFADGRGMDEMTWDEIEQKRISNEEFIAEQMDWKYYLPEAAQSQEVRAQLDKIQAKGGAFDVKSIKVIDPCMGSGHILVYAFDVLIQIYKEYGYSERDAAQSILQNNLYGLDIDDRAAQLAYFAVMMKARQYDRRIFTRGIQPNVYSIVESNGLDSNTIDYFANNDPKLKKDFGTLADELCDAKEYGSILNISQVDFAALYARVDEVRGDISLFREMVLNDVEPLIRVAEIMAQKYDVVVTNPPYLGSSRFSGKLSEYIASNYCDEKSDLAMTMLSKMYYGYVKPNGFVSAITTVSWMYLKNFEKFRSKVIRTHDFINLVDFGTELFDGKVGHLPMASWVARNTHTSQDMLAIRLVDFCYSRKDEKQIEFFNPANRHTVNQARFEDIEGVPFAYSATKAMTDAFEISSPLSGVANPKQGLITGDVNRFVRKWYEPLWTKVSLTGQPDDTDRKGKWFPYSNGGPFRKWYGNNEDVVDWENDGFTVTHFVDEKGKQRSRPQNKQFYFYEGGTWSAIAAGAFAVRYFPEGYMFSNAGMAIYANKEKLHYIIAFLNSKLAKKYLGIFNEGLNCNQGDVAKLPIIFCDSSQDKVTELEADCIVISRRDWDSFETSWDFQSHPLVRCAAFSMQEMAEDAKHHIRDMNYIEEAFVRWSNECYLRFNQLKANEEELNRIFIDIYGLQDELTPEVEDKDVTVRKADLGRDIRSLISYAVGCMFGRYSLDEPGLAYAGGEWDASKYSTIIPDKDNIIPICDDDYFDDDITGRFVKWVKTVYGSETLEENLKFIADALGGKGTPREVIRSYFINDFYADHLKIYQKRPIYWLFDSGKKNGFKALIYMHRYQSDLLARMRTDYVHEQQERYRTQLTHLADAIEHAGAAERVKLTKQQKKLQEQALEIQKYEEKIHHLADQNIQIDLDDGVKHNYELFADVLAKIK